MKRLILLTFFFFFFLSFISADFSIGNNSYLSKLSYGPSEFIEGNVNLSLDNFDSSVLLEDNFGNSISLYEWLSISGNFNLDFFCSPADCSLAYQKDSEHTFLSYDLNSGDELNLGIYLEGNLLSIDSLSFVLNSTANESCFTPYKIDFLDSENDLHVLGSGNLCSSFKNYGCFDSFSSASEYTMVGFPYCQRVTLPSAPSYVLGAWLKGEAGKNYNMEMQLYNTYGEAIEGGSCVLPSFSTQGEEVFCEVDVSFSQEDDYYLCLSSKNLNYPIIQVDEENVCGFINQNSDFYSSDSSSSYRFFVTPRKFSSLGDNLFNSSLSQNQDLSSMAVSYLSSVYGSLDCSSGCILPFWIFSNELQLIQLKDLNLKYIVSGRGLLTQNKFSTLDYDSALVNTNDRYKSFSLNKLNFSVGDDYGNSTYRLYLDGDLILEKEIYIQKVPEIKYLNPIKTFSNYPTEFNLNVESFDNSSIKLYTWNFGDGNIKTTQINKITHAYNSTGNYNLRIDVTDTLNRPSYKIFQIEVGSAREIINSTLFELKSDLLASKNYINSLGSYDKKILNSFLDIENLNAQLIQLEREFGQAYTQEEYNEILTSILSLKVPKSINVRSRVLQSPFFSVKSDINLDLIKEVTSSNFEGSKSDELKEVLLFWQNENLESLVSGVVYNIDFGRGDSSSLMVVQFSTKELKTISSSPYLFIKKLEGLSFEDKTPQDFSGYYYFELQSATNSFNFYSTEVSLSQLPLFISPSFTILNQYLQENPINPEDPEKINYYALIFSIILAILIGFFLYLFLYSWYKNKYENYLFKNQNNLYNLIAYIENAKQRGDKDEQIFSNLKKAGWSSEQINYVSKKHKNIDSGVFSIFTKFFSKSDKKPVLNENKSMFPLNKQNYFNRRKSFKLK